MIQLEIKEKGKKSRTFTCEVLPVTIGTRSSDTIILHEPEAAKGYCVLSRTKEGYRIGGTYHPDKVSVNKKPFSGVPLLQGDVIRIGKTKITVSRMSGRKQWADAVSEIMEKNAKKSKLKQLCAALLSSFTRIFRKKESSRTTRLDPGPGLKHPGSAGIKFLKRTLWWTGSILFHGILISIALVITVSEEDLDRIIASFDMELLNEPPMHVENAVKRDIVPRKIEAPSEIEIEDPVQQELISEVTLPEQEIVTEPAKSGISEDMKELSRIHIKSRDWAQVMGTASGGGAFGSRTAAGKANALQQYGGSEKTESAVRAALEWFKRHQRYDGSWSMTSFTEECKLHPRCGGTASGLEKGYPEWWDNCGTGFALLCFLGAGHTHQKGDYQEQVSAGIVNLLTVQDRNGSFAGGGYYHDVNYVHAITTMALCEAYGMTQDNRLKGPAQKAVEYILSRQNRFFGWDYEKRTGRNDTSVTGWQVMALKSARAAGLDIGDSFDGARRFFDRITPGISDSEEPVLLEHCAYLHYRNEPNQGHRNPTMTAIGMLGRILTGESPGSRVIRAHGNTLIQYLPEKYDRGDLYRWYYTTLAMFQAGGQNWKTWNDAIKPVLLDNQCVGGCADGSWAPSGTWSSSAGGRIFSTAMACLSLEVYYRYSPMMFSHEPPAETADSGTGEIRGRVKAFRVAGKVKASVKANSRTYIALDQQIGEILAPWDKQIVAIHGRVLREKGKLYIDGIDHIEKLRLPGSVSISRSDQGIFGWPCLDYEDELQMGGNFGYYTPPTSPDPFAGTWHLGEDVWVPAGTAVRSIGDGTVMNAGFSPAIKDSALKLMYGFGYFVIIEHELRSPVNGVTHVCSLYVHLSEKLAVKPGDKVYKGQPIGYVGLNMSEENGMCPEHLHFAIHRGRYYQLSDSLKDHLKETARTRGIYIRLPDDTEKEQYLQIEGKPGKWERVKGTVKGMLDEGNGTVHVIFEDGRTSVISTMMPVQGTDDKIPFWCRSYGTKEHLSEWLKPSTFIRLFHSDSIQQPRGNALVLKALEEQKAN